MKEDELLPLLAYPCPLCGNWEHKSVFSKVGIVITALFQIVRCHRCSHVFVNPRIRDDKLGQLYDEDYYRGQGFDRTVDYHRPITIREKKASLDLISMAIDAIAPNRIEDISWLDFGCGSGSLIEQLRPKLKIKGFDDSPIAQKICADKGIELIKTLEDLSNCGSSYDVVSAIEVIEHVGDPLGFVRFLTSLLKPGGILIVQTGNWNIAKLQPNTPYIMPEGHIGFFTPQKMKEIFSEVGLSISPVLNRSWFIYRDCPEPLRRYIPMSLFRAFKNLVDRVIPEFGQFPVGRKAT